MEHGRLLAIIAHEKLAQAEAGRFNGADARQKRVGACAAGEACGFGIQEGPPGGVGARNRAGRERLQKILGKFRQV
jgi:hypothetical protein